MDKRKGILNVSASLLSKIVLIITALAVRRLLVRYIGNEANGLNALFASIIGMLGVVELGAGSAITFSMYAPIIHGDRQKVAALYGLFRRAYCIIGAVIFLAGLAVMPFLPAIISDYEHITLNVSGSYLLTLVSVVISYAYSAKSALIDAHKNNYITTGILTVSALLRDGLQIVTILAFRSYPVFLICRIAGTLAAWLLVEIVVHRMHHDIIHIHAELDDETRKTVGRNIRAMFMHRVGTVLVNSIDSVIISAFIGVAVLGRYSNYEYIAKVLAGIIGLVFSSLTSVVGHLAAAGDRENTKAYFNRFYCINYMLGVVFFLGYFAVIDGVVAMFIGPGLMVSRWIAFIITLNQFTKFMRHTALLFRNASGAFYYDRWKPVGEGLLNLVLSLLFVQVFPEEYRVVGVIVATILTTLTICDIVDPYVVFRHVFDKSPYRFWLRNYTYIGVFTICLFALNGMTKPAAGLVGVVLNGLISVAVSVGAVGLVVLFDRSFRHEVIAILQSFQRRVSGMHG